MSKDMIEGVIIGMNAMLVIRAILGCFPIGGIGWGASRSSHPGFWWTRDETVYVRPVSRQKGQS